MDPCAGLFQTAQGLLQRFLGEPWIVKESPVRPSLYHMKVDQLSLRIARSRDTVGERRSWVTRTITKDQNFHGFLQIVVYRHAHTAQKAIKGVTSAFLDGLIAYDWPGNIRELENTLRSAIALCKTEYLTTHELKDLGAHSLARPVQGYADALAAAVVPFMKDALERKEKNLYEKVHSEVDKHLLEYALAHTRENQSEAARLLGINRLTLRKKLGLSK
jgi:DNA-binding protein Fis